MGGQEGEAGGGCQHATIYGRDSDCVGTFKSMGQYLVPTWSCGALGGGHAFNLTLRGAGAKKDFQGSYKEACGQSHVEF